VLYNLFVVVYFVSVQIFYIVCNSIIADLDIDVDVDFDGDVEAILVAALSDPASPLRERIVSLTPQVSKVLLPKDLQHGLKIEDSSVEGRISQRVRTELLPPPLFFANTCNEQGAPSPLTLSVARWKDEEGCKVKSVSRHPLDMSYVPEVEKILRQGQNEYDDFCAKLSTS
jgi:hypothetical protein